MGYNYVVVSTNGNLQFAQTSTATSVTLPSSTVNPIIAWFMTYTEPDPSYYYVTSGSTGSHQFLLRVPVGGAYLEVSPYGLFGGFDIVLFEADGHIEFRYYQFPSVISSGVTIGISGSSTDYAILVNNVSPSVFLSAILSSSVVSFTPVSFTPATYVAPQITAVTSTTSSYNVSFSTGVLSTTSSYIIILFHSILL